MYNNVNNDKQLNIFIVLVFRHLFIKLIYLGIMFYVHMDAVLLLTYFGLQLATNNYSAVLLYKPVLLPLYNLISNHQELV